MGEIVRILIRNLSTGRIQAADLKGAKDLSLLLVLRLL